MNANKVLYDYIVYKYGEVVNLSEISEISPIDLNAVLLKDNVSREIGIGLNLCHILNIDIEKMVFDTQIKEFKSGKFEYIPEKPKPDKKFKPDITNQSDESAKDEIYGKCVRLSEIEKKKVLEYIDSLTIS